MALREDLDSAIAASFFPVTYQRRIDELRARHNHTIQIVHRDDIDQFNCFAFATGISELPQYRALV